MFEELRRVGGMESLHKVHVHLIVATDCWDYHLRLLFAQHMLVEHELTDLLQTRWYFEVLMFHPQNLGGHLQVVTDFYRLPAFSVHNEGFRV